MPLNSSSDEYSENEMWLGDEVAGNNEELEQTDDHTTNIYNEL